MVGGAGTLRIVARHIVPNLLGPVIVYATLTVPQVILVQSFLSFLGIGIQEPLASLGNLIADGAAEMETERDADEERRQTGFADDLGVPSPAGWRGAPSSRAATTRAVTSSSPAGSTVPIA